MTPTPAERFRENATEITGTLVTGLWLAALFTGQDWWLGAMLFGYIVVVPLVALLFGDEDDIDEWWDDEWNEPWFGRKDDTEPAQDDEGNARDALETLRQRYANGELTDEQFERKLERLLDTESIESVEDYVRERERTRD